jgi:hypothetical protein
VVGVQVNLLHPNKATYTLDLKLDEYAALSARDRLHSDSEKKFAEKYLRFDFPEFELEKFGVTHKDDLSQPLELHYNFKVEKPGEEKPNHLYFQPIVLDLYKDNPFKAENRYYPVEYNYPSSLLYLLTLTLPEGYEVEETPKDALIRLPGQMGDFTYQVQKEGSSVQLRAQVNFHTSTIPSANYSQLKQFYDLIGAKFKEPIVLKKL